MTYYISNDDHDIDVREESRLLMQERIARHDLQPGDVVIGVTRIGDRDGYHAEIRVEGIVVEARPQYDHVTLRPTPEAQRTQFLTADGIGYSYSQIEAIG